jgi:hypothetical protein
MKIQKIIYWISTILLCLLMTASATMYFVNNQVVKEIFTQLGYPTYLVYPLAIAKLLGIIAIITKKSKLLKEWAYAGFFFDFLLAFAAHLNANDGGIYTPLIAIFLLFTSYFFDKQLFD